MPGNTCEFDLTRSRLGTCAERVQTGAVPQGQTKTRSVQSLVSLSQ